MFRSIYAFAIMVFFAGALCTAQVPASKLQRDMANLQADLDGVRQDERVLLGRIAELEQENQRKNAQIRDLQNLISAMEQRLQDVEKNFSKALDNEREARRRELKSFGNEVSRELESRGRSSEPSVPAGNYTVIKVKPGDTLSFIASMVGCPVSKLKEINGLKNDNIRVGQELRVPAK